MVWIDLIEKAGRLVSRSTLASAVVQVMTTSEATPPASEIRSVQLHQSEGQFPHSVNEFRSSLVRHTGGSVSAESIDIEQLLVRQGWFWLQSRVIGCVQEVAIGTSKRVSRTPLRLTPREFEVTSLSAGGLMAKEVGAKLGITEATTRATLSRALLKLGVGKGSRLVAIWNALNRPGQSFDVGPDQTTLVFACDLAPYNAAVDLTSTEREILSCLLGGASNRAISDQRGTSERTVANQVARILKKFHVSTRRELSVKVLGGDEAFDHNALIAKTTTK